jgi:uncharacterized protein (TIGR00369 family)
MTIATSPGARLTIAELNALIDEHFPQVHEGNGRLTIEFLGSKTARVRMAEDARSTRPGGTISGPAMFKLADFSGYVAIMAELGTAAIGALTTNMTINFLSRPDSGDMMAEARLLKVGRRLAVAEVSIQANGKSDLVAHATGTYALPLR